MTYHVATHRQVRKFFQDKGVITLRLSPFGNMKTTASVSTLLVMFVNAVSAGELYFNTFIYVFGLFVV